MDQWKSLPIYLSFILATVFFSKSTVADISGCLFEDTVNITGNYEYKDGFYYYYNKYKVPERLVGNYTYESTFGSETEAKEQHLRACICQVTSCIQLCCGLNEEKIKLHRSCAPRLNHDAISPYVNVIHSNGTKGLRNILEDFAIQTHLPCTMGTYKKHYELFENGTLVSHNIYYSKKEYCLLPIRGRFHPLICLE